MKYAQVLSLEALSALSDDEISYDEIPPLDEAFWQKAQFYLPSQPILPQDKAPSRPQK